MIFFRQVMILFFDVLSWLIIVRALLTWFIRDERNPIMHIMLMLTEPILSPIRKLLYRFNIGGNMVDFSPLVAILLIQMLMQLVVVGLL